MVRSVIRMAVGLTGNNYSIKMDEDKLLNNLLDFSRLTKQPQNYHSALSNSRPNKQSLQPQIQDYQQLMKSFRDMRDKVKTSTRQSSTLRQEMVSLQNQLRQVHESEKNFMVINHQLKERNCLLVNSNEELKKKVGLMREQVAVKKELSQEVAFLKAKLIDVQGMNRRLLSQKEKLIEISIQEKLQVQEKMNQLQAKYVSAQQHAQNLQQRLGNSQQNTIKLQNQLKKLSIKYDQQKFHKEWATDNFKLQHQQATIKELQANLQDMKNRNRKQKEKRAQLEQRLIQLEQNTGMWNLKAEAYQGETALANKKLKKMQRTVSKAKMTANQMANLSINWQDKFQRCLLIAQEMISRAKRQVVGDIVELAKSCEFRLNKLKDHRQSQQKPRESATKSKKNRKQVQKIFNNTLKNAQPEQKNQVFAQTFKVLGQSNGSNILSSSKRFSQGKDSKENILQQSQSKDLQGKIRRERELMQRKLRQKILYRKVQVAGEDERGRLRDDYLRHVLS